MVVNLSTAVLFMGLSYVVGIAVAYLMFKGKFEYRLNNYAKIVHEIVHTQMNKMGKKTSIFELTKTDGPFEDAEQQILLHANAHKFIHESNNLWPFLATTAMEISPQFRIVGVDISLILQSTKDNKVLKEMNFFFNKLDKVDVIS